MHYAAGFTVAELVAALAITAVVAALGVSAYRTYVVRSQIDYSVELATPLRSVVVAAFRRHGEPPAGAVDLGLHVAHGAPWQYVESAVIIDGRIEIRFSELADAAIAGQTLSLTPFETATGDVVWLCGNERPGAGLEPLGFVGGARQAKHTLTTIEPRYLPSHCR